ncbi:hypothetical protein HY838_02300 [Candidatus Azambacteria bacterium]|nr:hypothetical protein [Candidatus Azambacteria bacterium]
MTSEVDSKIFRAYDIRGIYPDELDESAAYKIGRAFAVYLKENETEKPEKIFVGNDARDSSSVLKRAFMEGAADGGFNVSDIGLATVDMVYFASGRFNLPAAMITASHNPKGWNGFKLMKSGVDFFNVKDLEAIISEKRSDRSELKGEVKEENIEGDYLNHVLSFIDIDAIRPMRIMIGADGGVINPILKSIVEKLPIEIDDNHYQFGCVFDADGDRANFTDENGEKVNPSIAGALMAKYFLKRNLYGKIVFSATASKIISDIADIYNGEAIREKVGHTFIKKRMKEVGGILGVETSGHYYFKNNFYADSGVISFLTMLQILSEEKKNLSVLVSELSKYVSISEMNFEVSDPERLIKKIAENFEGYDLDWLDGLTARTPDFWFNLRPSNTEPLIRLNIEAKDELILNRVKDDLMKLIEKENASI